MSQQQPSVVVLCGPNGAGKSTTGPPILRDTLGITEFVDADLIARGLSAFDPEGTALEAGKVMLRRVHELAGKRADFAFETTLAARSFAPWLAGLRAEGYKVHVVFLWLPSAAFAVERVAERVRTGGHSVPEHVVRRRYRLGLANFFRLYQPLADTWQMYDNSCAGGPRLVAVGAGRRVTCVADAATWERIREDWRDGDESD